MHAARSQTKTENSHSRVLPADGTTAAGLSQRFLPAKRNACAAGNRAGHNESFSVTRAVVATRRSRKDQVAHVEAPPGPVAPTGKRRLIMAHTGVELADDLPNYSGHSGKLMLKLITVWVAIGFRRLEITLGKT